MHRNTQFYGMVLLSFSLMMIGCGSSSSSHPSGPRVSTSSKSTRTVEKNTSSVALFAAEDFDLATVDEYIRTNWEELKGQWTPLEEFINDPERGINNVDVDADGNVDYVGIQETQDGTTRKISFVALHSSTQDQLESANDEKIKELTTPVAEMSITVNESTQTAETASYYPEYASGSENHYYHHHHNSGSGFATGFLFGYLLTPRYPLYGWGMWGGGYYGGYYRSYYRGGYGGVRVASRSTVTTRRTTTRRSSGLSSTTQRSSGTKPKTTKVSGAGRVKSQLASGKRTAPSNKNSLSSRASSSKDFQSKKGQTQKKATALGGASASKSSSSSTSKSSGPKKPSGWNSGKGGSSTTRGKSTSSSSRGSSSSRSRSRGSSSSRGSSRGSGRSSRSGGSRGGK